MNEELEERIYQGVRRMVIWDEPRDDVFQRLEINGITGEKAQQMYKSARAERIAIIRSDSMRKAACGLGLLIVGVGSFFAFCVGLEVINRLVLAICGSATAFGALWFFKGLGDFIHASSKEGSLADED